MLSHQFTEAADSALVAPWAEAHRRLTQRAVDRGEAPAGADTETSCQVQPTMAAYRALVQRLPFDRDFLVSSLDVVILPAQFAAAGATVPTS